jgi:hypothetical protein
MNFHMDRADVIRVSYYNVGKTKGSHEGAAREVGENLDKSLED